MAQILTLLSLVVANVSLWGWQLHLLTTGEALSTLFELEGTALLITAFTPVGWPPPEGNLLKQIKWFRGPKDDKGRPVGATVTADLLMLYSGFLLIVLGAITNYCLPNLFPELSIKTTNSPSSLHITPEASGSLNWVAITMPAIFAAALTTAFGHYFSLRRSKRQACLNAIALLNGYEEELRTGLRSMKKLRKFTILREKDTTVRENTKAFQPVPDLPRKFWEPFKLSHDGITEIWLLKNQTSRAPYNKIHELPSHLKNCFDHITVNFKSTAEKLSEAIGWREDFSHHNFDTLIGGYCMTLRLVRFAKRGLNKKARDWKYF